MECIKDKNNPVIHFAPELFQSCLSSSPEKLVQELLSVIQTVAHIPRVAHGIHFPLPENEASLGTGCNGSGTFGARLAVFLQDPPVCISILSMEYWGTVKQSDFADTVQWVFGGTSPKSTFLYLFSWNHRQHKHAPHATAALLLGNARKFPHPIPIPLPAPV